MQLMIRAFLVSLLMFGPLPFSSSSTLDTPFTVVSNPVTQPDIASGSALMIDMATHEVVYRRNPNAIVPIASLTKLMTAMIVLDKGLPLDEVIPVTFESTQELNGVFSRLKPGSKTTRRNMLLLTLMASENRAASALAHSDPDGYSAFIQAMNEKARQLGMTNTHYVEPTGLSQHNVSTAYDITQLLFATRDYPLLNQLSTHDEQTVEFKNPRYRLTFRNTNYLVTKADWSIALSKTGYTKLAGHCLALRTTINQREMTLVVLDAFGKYTHFADANRLRKWLETGEAPPVPETAKRYRQHKAQQHSPTPSP